MKRKNKYSIKDSPKSIVETSDFSEAAILRHYGHDLHSISKDGDKYIYRLYYRSDTHSIIDDFETCRLEVEPWQFMCSIQELIMLRMSAAGELDEILEELKKHHDEYHDKEGLDQDF